MSPRFINHFVLPLIRGGRLQVGGPLGFTGVKRIWRRVHQSEEAAEVARLRQFYGARFMPGFDEPLPLDETSLRLAAAAHNLLLLGHPEMSGHEREQERVAELARQMADLAPPGNPAEAVARFSVLARLPETVRVEHHVHAGPSWLRFELHKSGPTPGALMRALSYLSSTSVEARRRAWWKEIGFPTCADRAIGALFRACPLLEAMDPLRLHPPLSWRRILPVLRFPNLARVVADRVLDLGYESAGSALAGALLRFASVADEDGAPASAQELAFAIRFVSHVFWLHQLFDPADELAPDSDLAVLLVAAAEVEPRLLWPPDVAHEGEPGRRFAQSLQRLAAEAPKLDRYRAMQALCR